VALAPEIARFNFEKELGRARELASRFKWGWKDDVEALTLRVEYTALDDEPYILVGTFDDYKEKPPFLEFEEPGTGALGTAKAYPKGHDSFFHTTGPSICAPFSRKAYQTIHTSGWEFKDWMTSTESGTRWSQRSTIAGMLQMIYDRLNTREYYIGRMG
jgi:hypothetical protein